MQSLSKRVNLHLSRSDSIKSTSSVNDRPSSHTDLLVEANFLHESSLTKGLEFKSTSLQRIKNLMQKTTEKLNVYNKPHNENNQNDELIEKNKEILYLKGIIKKLETEK